MFNRNFGKGIIGRAVNAALDVIVFTIVIVLVIYVLSLVHVVLPGILLTLIEIALAIYFLGRLFGVIGPVDPI